MVPSLLRTNVVHRSHQCAKLCVYNDVTAVHDLQERLCSDALLLWRGRARYPLSCPCRRIIAKVPVPIPVPRQDTLWSWSGRRGCVLICERLQLLFGSLFRRLGSLTSAGKAFPQQFRSTKRHPTVNSNWGKQTRAGETWRSVPAPRVLVLSALASSYRAEDRPQLSGSGFASQLAMLVASEEECSRHVPHCHIPPTPLLPRPSPQRLSSAGCASLQCM